MDTIKYQKEGKIIGEFTTLQAAGDFIYNDGVKDCHKIHDSIKFKWLRIGFVSGILFMDTLIYIIKHLN